MIKKSVATFVVVALSSALTSIVAQAQTGVNDPQRILNRQLEELQQQQQERQTDTTEKPVVIEGVPDPSTVQQDKDVAPFTLKELRFSDSEVFTPEELKSFSSELIDQQVNLQRLRDFATSLERYYIEKGFIARVILPPQKIQDGVVSVQLIEARIGEELLEGNATTKSSFISKRIDVGSSGDLLNLQKLERSLVKINNVYDINMRAQLKPGEVFASSDIVLTTFEPERNQLTLVLDNYGNNSTGEFEQQLIYSNTSLTGHRDRLDANFRNAEGSMDGSVAYSFYWPGSDFRTLLFYAASDIDIVNGPIQDLGVKGDSSVALIDVTKPLYIRSDRVLSARASYDSSESKTKIGSVELQKIDTDTAKLGLGYWQRGDRYYWSGNMAIGQSTSSGEFSGTNIGDEDYTTLSGDLFFYYDLTQGYSTIVRGNYQYSKDNQIPSAGQFQIGGIGSVRGYDNGLLSGYKGYSLSAEFHRNWDASMLQSGSVIDGYIFLDNGQVDTTDSRREDDLTSLGFGADWLMIKGITLTATAAWAASSIDQEKGDYSLYVQLSVPLLDLW